jgi:hypothetical protein
MVKIIGVEDEMRVALISFGTAEFSIPYETCAATDI